MIASHPMAGRGYIAFAEVGEPEWFGRIVVAIGDGYFLADRSALAYVEPDEQVVIHVSDFAKPIGDCQRYIFFADQDRMIDYVNDFHRGSGDRPADYWGKE